MNTQIIHSLSVLYGSRLAPTNCLETIIIVYNLCQEKHDCYIISYKNQARAMFSSLLYLLSSHCCVERKWIRDHGMVTWPILQTNCREQTDNSRTHTPIGTVLKTVQSKQTDIELGTLYEKCDCSSRAHTWYTPAHPITVVHPWKILVHPGVYNTPSWQGLV